MDDRLEDIGHEIITIGQTLSKGEVSKSVEALSHVLSKLRRMSSPVQKVANEEFMTRLDRMIDSSLSDSELSVEYIAKEMLLSRSQLYKLFSERNNCRLGDYISEKRIIAAQKLLCDHENSILEVSYAVGFVSQRYFSTFFKKHVGMTPTQWRMELSRS